MKVKRFHKYVLIGIAAVIGINIWCGMAFSAVEQEATPQKEPSFTEKMSAILFQEQDDAFVYKREGRNDQVGS